MYASGMTYKWLTTGDGADSLSSPFFRCSASVPSITEGTVDLDSCTLNADSSDNLEGAIAYNVKDVVSLAYSDNLRRQRRLCYGVQDNAREGSHC